MMRNVGGTSEFYESNDFEVSEASERSIEDYYGTIREEVSEHYDHNELYNGVFGQS